jgi:hypothetical protein
LNLYEKIFGVVGSSDESWCLNGGVVEESLLLGYDAVSLDTQFPPLQRNTVPSSSRAWRSETSTHEDEGDLFL